MAMGQNLWCHIWVDEYPFTIYFDVHWGTTALTHGHIIGIINHTYWVLCTNLAIVWGPHIVAIHGRKVHDSPLITLLSIKGYLLRGSFEGSKIAPVVFTMFFCTVFFLLSEQWLRDTPVGWWLVQGFYFPTYLCILGIVYDCSIIQEREIPFWTD